MTTARLFINKKTVKKDGSVVIYAIVYIEGKSIKFNTGVSVPLNRYDSKKERVKGSTKEDIDKNLIIDRCLSSINEIFVRYRLQNRPLTADLLIREYENPTYYIDFYKYLEDKIRERVKSKEIAHVSGLHHTVLLNKLKQFKSSLTFAEIDLKFLNSFKAWCRTKEKNSVNTVQKKMGYLKAYLNIARREEIIRTNPFDNFQMKRIDTQRLYLTEPELKKLMELYDKERFSDSHQRTLRHYLFMCLTGIRISDFIRMKKENVQDNVLKFVPYKTNSKKKIELHVPLIDKAKKLILDENSMTGYLFNAITEQKMNYQLKDIAQSAGINKEISNHSARHTFATLFLDKTSDVATLQKLLGHSNIEETMTYVHISNKKLDTQMGNFNQALGLTL
jgi:site-specific recombinase XerD